jgi:hypothetical protein
MLAPDAVAAADRNPAVFVAAEKPRTAARASITATASAWLLFMLRPYGDGCQSRDRRA